MKKRLLFSLLLGSAFIWTNELHTASEATAPAGEEKSAEKIEAEAKADAPKGEEEKKYKAIGLDGKEIEVQFFDKSKHPDLVLKKLFLQDGQAYSHCSDSDPRNVPYIAGELPPAGCAVVNVFRKNNNPDELKFMGPAVANGAVPDYAVKNEELWMYFDGKFLYPFDDVEDPNAKLILKNNEVKVYSYEIVDSENSAKAKELQEALKKSADLEEKLKTPGTGGGSPEDAAKVKELEARVEELKKNSSSSAAPIMDPSAPLTKTFEFEGMKFLVLASSAEAKKHPELFDELVMGLFKLFSTQPKVATAIIATMLKSDEAMEGGGQLVNASVSDAYKLLGSTEEITLVADLQFSTEISYEKAHEFTTNLKVKYNNDDMIIPEPDVSAAEVTRLQAEHEAESKAKDEELAAAKAESEKALAAVAQLSEEKVEAEAEARAAELAAAKAIQEKDAAVTVAAQAFDQADKEAIIAAKNIQEMHAIESELNQSQNLLSDVEAEKEKFAAAQQQTQAVLAATQINLATLSAEKTAAETAAETANKDKEIAQRQLEHAHGALVDVAKSTATSSPDASALTTPVAEHAAEPVVAEHTAEPVVAPVAQTEHTAAPVADPTSVATDLDAIAKEHGVPNNKQLTADILNQSAPHPLVSSLASAAPAA